MSATALPSVHSGFPLERMCSGLWFYQYFIVMTPSMRRYDLCPPHYRDVGAGLCGTNFYLFADRILYYRVQTTQKLAYVGGTFSGINR